MFSENSLELLFIDSEQKMVKSKTKKKKERKQRYRYAGNVLCLFGAYMADSIGVAFMSLMLFYVLHHAQSGFCMLSS